MTETALSNSSAKSAQRRHASDVVLVAAFVIFAGAMGAILHLMLEVEPEIAALAALSCLSMLVAIHALARRASTVSALDSEIASLKSELANLRARPRSPSSSSPVPDESRRPGGQPMVSSDSAGRPTPQGAGTAVPPQISPPGATEAGSAPPLRSVPLPRMPARAEEPAPTAVDIASGIAVGAQSDAALSPAQFAAAVDGGAQEHRDPAIQREHGISPYWALRPGNHREPHGTPVAGTTPVMRTGHVPTGPLPLLEGGQGQSVSRVEAVAASIAADPPFRLGAEPPMGQWPQAAPETSNPPIDLGTMQNLIEQLAVQLNQPRVPEDSTEVEPAIADVADPVPPIEVAPPTIRGPRPPQIKPLPPSHGSFAPQRRPITPAPLGQLALIAEAVEANRMDVYLDPILGLSDRRARHFELSVRLLTGHGDTLDRDDYAHPAAGTGLLGRIDLAKLSRAAEVAQRLKARGSHASLFSNIAGESLSDENFIGTFADILDAEDGLGAKLVLTFTQADARAFTGAHWDAISAMAEIGIKFALEDVRDLDMDFSLLRWHGFDFIKLEAAVFLEGLPTPSGHIPAADICRHLSGIGLGLIIGGIVEEKELAKILGFGALLGQGSLFGSPRSVQLDIERRAA